MQKIDVKVKNIDGLLLKIFKIVEASFIIVDNLFGAQLF